jgi:hypothetical protein
VESDDDRLRVRRHGDEARHRHAVDKDDAGTWSAHPSVLSKIAPLGVRPPLLTTATRASAT